MIDRDPENRSLLTRRAFIGACGATAGLALWGARPRSTVDDVYARSPELLAIRNRALAGVPSDPRIRHILSHRERVLLASGFLWVSGGIEEIHRILRHCPDYDRTITDRHLEALKIGATRC